MALHTTSLHRLDALSIYSYALPLKSGKLREGVLVCEEKTGRWAEAAPLPGRSRETVEDVLRQLLGGTDEALYPSVQFCLESLRVKEKFPLCVPVWDLLEGSVEEILGQVAESPHTHIKIKISQLAVTEAKELISRLNNPNVHFRVDCNRAFSLQEAVSIFSQAQQKLCIEEPLKDIAELHQFPLPFALDETLEQFPSFPIEQYPNLTTLVLKPTIFGGELGCRPYLDKGRRIIFTGAYESGVGTLQVAALGRKFQGECEPVGIGTYAFLADDIVTPRLQFQNGTLCINTFPQIALQQLTFHGRSVLPF